MKEKTDILSALEKNIPAEIIVADTNVPSAIPSREKMVTDSEEDYEFTRARVKKLIETSDEAISVMMNLASDSEHPRAFEVLANLIKTAADVNNQLISIQKDRKKLIETQPVKGEITTSSSTTNNTIFVGTTSELQKLIKQQTVDV
jgi:hypothetical protein